MRMTDKQTVKDAFCVLRVFMKFHVKAGACVDIGGKIHSTSSCAEQLKLAHEALDELYDKAALIEVVEGMRCNPRHPETNNIDLEAMGWNQALDAALKAINN